MESKLCVEDRSVVVPGMVLASGIDYLPSKGTYRKDDKILASRLGLLQLEGKVIKIVPLAGRYLPKKDDVAIGKVIDVLLTGWRVDINSPYEAVLTMKDASNDFIQRGADLTRYFALNDWMVCQIVQVTSQNLIDVGVRGPGLRKLIGGTIISVGVHKVPRIIGKRGSMVGMIKRATDCNIVVGQNGRVWLNGTPENERIAIEAIQMIERLAHTRGLTERVKKFLEERTGRKVEPTEDSGENIADGEEVGPRRPEHRRELFNRVGGRFRKQFRRPGEEGQHGPPRDGGGHQEGAQ